MFCLQIQRLNTQKGISSLLIRCFKDVYRYWVGWYRNVPRVLKKKKIIHGTFVVLWFHKYTIRLGFNDFYLLSFIIWHFHVGTFFVVKLKMNSCIKASGNYSLSNKKKYIKSSHCVLVCLSTSKHRSFFVCRNQKHDKPSWNIYD